jgi:hypothetical protein
MALLGKERAVSPTLSTTTVEISVIIIDLIINLAKVLILEVAKPKSFYGSR